MILQSLFHEIIPPTSLASFMYSTWIGSGTADSPSYLFICEWADPGDFPMGGVYIEGNATQPGTSQRANVVELPYTKVYRTQRIRRERRIFFKQDSLTLF